MKTQKSNLFDIAKFLKFDSDLIRCQEFPEYFQSENADRSVIKYRHYLSNIDFDRKAIAKSLEVFLQSVNSLLN